VNGALQRGDLGLGQETRGDQVPDELAEAGIDPHLAHERQGDRHQEAHVGIDARQERHGGALAGSISRYIVVAVVRCSWACSPLPVRR
jgi:hypothetical protein